MPILYYKLLEYLKKTKINLLFAIKLLLLLVIAFVIKRYNNDHQLRKNIKNLIDSKDEEIQAIENYHSNLAKAKDELSESRLEQHVENNDEHATNTKEINDKIKDRSKELAENPEELISALDKMVKK